MIGCGGAGKTTLANALGERLGLPVVHIDSYYWRWADGRRIESAPAQWRATHRELISAPEWIIEGMKFGVLDERLGRADTVIFLDLPTSTCLSGLLARRRRHGRAGDPQRGIYSSLNWPTFRWVLGFRRRHRPLLVEKLASFDGSLVTVRNRRDATRVLEDLAG